MARRPRRVVRGQGRAFLNLSIYLSGRYRQTVPQMLRPRLSWAAAFLSRWTSLQPGQTPRRVLWCIEAGSLELPQRPLEQWFSHRLVEERVDLTAAACGVHAGTPCTAAQRLRPSSSPRSEGLPKIVLGMYRTLGTTREKKVRAESRSRTRQAQGRRGTRLRLLCLRC